VGESLQRFWAQRGDAIILNALQIALIVALLVVARWLGARVISVITRALMRKVEASERRQAQIRTVERATQQRAGLCAAVSWGC
jgi:hypothetical protein